VPDFPDIFELPDVKRIQAYRVAWLRRSEVRTNETAPHAFGDQARAPPGGSAAPTGRQAMAFENAVRSRGTEVPVA
jgi:hypothetical protein